MAKKIISNGTLKIVLAIAGILVTVGVIYSTICTNKERIAKVEIKSQNNQIAIVELKTDVKYIREGVDEIKEEIKK